MLKGCGVHVVFYSILPVRGNGIQEEGHELNRVCGWMAGAVLKGFGFCYHGSIFEKPGLLRTDGIPPVQVVQEGLCQQVLILLGDFIHPDVSQKKQNSNL